MLVKFNSESEWLAAKVQDVTSTEVASLFGLNPYKSRRRLWHEKRGDIEPDFVDSPFAKWGRRLQVPVARGICEDEGWVCQDLSLYYARDPALRMGASFDIKAITPDGAIMLEIKVAEQFSEEQGWTKDAAPLPYEFQLQTQLHLAMKEDTTIKAGCIGTLGKRQSTRLYHRAYDASVGAMIEEETASFWKSIETNAPPDPDYLVDSELLEKLRGPIRGGDIINLTNNERAKQLLYDYQVDAETVGNFKTQMKPTQERMARAKNELISMIGRNEKAIIGGLEISAKVQSRDDSVTYGSSFRRFDLKKRK